MTFVWNGTTEMRLITYFPYFQCFKQEVGVKEGFELYVLKVLSKSIKVVIGQYIQWSGEVI